MSGWLDRAAVRFARTSRDSPPLHPGEGSPHRPHVDSGRVMTRRDSARVMGGTVASLTALTLTHAAPAAADDYCYDACYDNALNNFHDRMSTQKIFAIQHLTGYGVIPAWSIAYWGGFLGYSWGAFVNDASKCNQTDCGDPTTYPPPKSTGGPHGGGPQAPAPEACPPQTGACPGMNPPQCCFGSDYCCGCGVCCTFAMYCDSCCSG